MSSKVKKTRETFTWFRPINACGDPIPMYQKQNRAFWCIGNAWGAALHSLLCLAIKAFMFTCTENCWIMHSVIHSWSTNLPWCRFLAAIICWCCIALYAFLHAEICHIASQNIICAPQEAGTAAFCPAPSRDRRDNYGVPVSLQVTKEDVSFGCLFSVVLLNKMLLLSILVLIMKCVAGPELWCPQPPP